MDHNSPRALVDHLDQACARLLRDLKQIVHSIPPESLYQGPSYARIGENILRSAAALEQTFGGLTANLWDDPFEWTLPEALSTAELVAGYLSEVDAARQTAFKSIVSDSELTKFISGPTGEPQPLFALLVATLMKAGDYYGRAVASKNFALQTTR